MQRKNLTDMETPSRFHAIPQGHWQEVNRRGQDNKLSKQHQQLNQMWLSMWKHVFLLVLSMVMAIYLQAVR
jgi:hypothetical protein